MASITIHHVQCDEDFVADYDEIDLRNRRLVYLSCPKCKTDIKLIMKRDEPSVEADKIESH
jgi:formate dehydrogenase maturation protein FdhE